MTFRSMAGLVVGAFVAGLLLAAVRRIGLVDNGYLSA